MRETRNEQAWGGFLHAGRSEMTLLTLGHVHSRLLESPEWQSH